MVITDNHLKNCSLTSAVTYSHSDYKIILDIPTNVTSTQIIYDDTYFADTNEIITYSIHNKNEYTLYIPIKPKPKYKTVYYYKIPKIKFKKLPFRHIDKRYCNREPKF